MGKIFRIYIDMDRTLVDYDKGLLLYPDLKFPQSHEGFFYALDPLKGAIESYKYLESKHDVWILTKPSFYNIGCYTDKAKWVLDYLGFEAQKKTIFCGDKSLVKGDILIDDHYLHGQPDFEGKWIQIGTEKYPDWSAVINEINLLELDK